MFSLESPHRGDSNEYKRYTIFNIRKKITLNYPKSAAMFFFKGLKNEFETAMVNEPSMFEPLKVLLYIGFWPGLGLPTYGHSSHTKISPFFQIIYGKNE